jgi:hypothetical protein
VSLECIATKYHRPGIEALSRLCYLQKFQFALSTSEISHSELKLVSLCMCLMPGLKTVGRCKFLPDTSDVLISLRSSYHSVESLQFHQQTPALEEFYAHSDFWTADTVRLLPSLKRLHVIRDNEHIPDTLQQLGLYHNGNLQTVRAFTTNLLALTLYKCDLSGVPIGGLLALCPNLGGLVLLDCHLEASSVALNDDVCLHCRLRVLMFRGEQGVPVDGVVSRLLQAPMLRIVSISANFVSPAEVRQLVQQVQHKEILQMGKMLRFEGENLEPLVKAVQVFLPKAVHFNTVDFLLPFIYFILM